MKGGYMEKEYKPGYFIRPSEVAKILDVSMTSVYKLINEGKLKTVIIGKVKRVYYPNLCEYIENYVKN